MSLSKERNYLLYLLAKQDYSRNQLSMKLHQRENITSEEIDNLLDIFEQNKWLSDERFAEIFVESEVDKLRGKKRIINTGVYNKGLAKDLVDTTLENAEIDWYELCRQCLLRKYKDISKLKLDMKLKQKAVNYLAYNGFDYDQISFAINSEI
jgi:regulatory protein